LRRRADGKMRDLLFLAVIKQLEILALQITNQLSLFVQNDDVYLNQFGLDSKQRLILFLLLLAFLLLRLAYGNFDICIQEPLLPMRGAARRMGRSGRTLRPKLL